MTKYIDLLRTHQQQPVAGEKLTQSEATIEEQEPTLASVNTPQHHENPYSTKQSHSDKNSQDELLEEDESQVSQTQTSIDEGDELLVEETQEIPVPVVAAVVKSERNPEETTSDTPKQVINSGDFNVSTWLQQISNTLIEIFHAAQQEKATDFASLNAHLRALLSQLESDDHTLDALELEVSLNMKHICESETSLGGLIQKSVMMMLYTIKVGIQLKLQHEEILHHTAAAMLHHIGMAMVPDDIRLKAGKLNKDEIALIRQAPKKGLEYLKTCHIENDSILLATAQSGERFDGSGPSGLSGHSIAWVARIIGLLSMFEALIHLRPYRQRLLPRDAIRELVNHHKKEFDPVLLKALIESISLYPVGTFVQLNTGEIGQVIMVHNKFPLRPVVHVNLDKYGNKITERRIDLRQQPNLMIQKCMYEESLEEIEKENFQS